MSLLILFEGQAGPPVAAINVLDINVYSKKLVRILFDDEVIVNDTYNDPSNYSISVVDGSGPVEVVGVLPTNETTSLEVILITQPMTPGTKYSISITELSNRSGITFSVLGLYYARDTKVDSILRSIPSHFDKRPTSILASILTAIAINDDIIGGSRNDAITYT